MNHELLEDDMVNNEELMRQLRARDDLGFEGTTLIIKSGHHAWYKRLGRIIVLPFKYVVKGIFEI